MDSIKNNAQVFWGAVKRHAREHHESVTAAHETLYPRPLPTISHKLPKEVYSPRSSFDSERPDQVISYEWSRLETRKFWKQFSKSSK
ncbi:hypothetical protein NLU13_0139 [Sarocladium strictum]|uniref:Uncharacterized protein n=1 Tax=Sarocladium strictum TaxID=5046 RepID=A0AA39LB59_SARSR|nr:hypothetical protein NLU13_0139 [Sarocladium strictum]